MNDATDTPEPQRWLAPEQLLHRLGCQLLADAVTAGADPDAPDTKRGVEQALADRLGVTRTEMAGFNAVWFAADRYQHPPPTQHPTPRRPID